MTLLDKLKDALVPQTEKGVRLQCTECGTTFDDFDEVQDGCPVCGSSEIKEEEAFEFRPQE